MNTKLIERAMNEIRKYAAVSGDVFNDPSNAITLATLRIGNEKREHFMVMFLSAQNTLIADEILFSGTIDSASVYPRIVAQRALELNASAVILAHNHPSGTVEPSEADKRITWRIREAMGLLDIRLLDHVIVSGAASCSFAYMGLL